ncbi:hypothetical protein G6F35_013024 [Rhizopus arrhizus]|nr:hypothetical protein G6F35_013024 [Rhizopus arrhizus]
MKSYFSTVRRNIPFTSNQPSILPIDHTYITRTEEDDNNTPQMQGWLHKQGCKYKTWNKRWFVLKGSNLFYFKSSKDVRMKGIINLRGYRIITDESIQPGKYSFKAQHEEERTFYFYTDNENSMKSWITNLMKSTISRDLAAPVLSSRVISTVSLDVARRMRPRPPSVLIYKSKKPTCEPSPVLPEELVNQDSGFDSDNQTFDSSFRQIDEDDEDEGIEQDDAGSWGRAEFIEWVNAICQGANISSLDQLKQENILVELLQELSGKEVRSFKTQDSIADVFEFMAQEGIPSVNELFNAQGKYLLHYI